MEGVKIQSNQGRYLSGYSTHEVAFRRQNQSAIKATCSRIMAEWKPLGQDVEPVKKLEVVRQRFIESLPGLEECHDLLHSLAVSVLIHPTFKAHDKLYNCS